jgi:[acyl-carrier-protein] S-malonyltransferase
MATTARRRHLGAKAAVDGPWPSPWRQAGGAIPLAVSIAAHSSPMASIQKDWDAAVSEAHVGDTQMPIIGNVSAKLMRTAADLREDIQRQMQSRVRWTETIENASWQGVTTFVEMGTGTVLLGLIRRIAAEATGLPLGTPADLSALE